MPNQQFNYPYIRMKNGNDKFKSISRFYYVRSKKNIFIRYLGALNVSLPVIDTASNCLGMLQTS